MSSGGLPEPGDEFEHLWDDALHEAHAMLTLALVSSGNEVRPGREQEMVELSVQAGVLGMLSVLRRANNPDEH